MDRCGMDEYCNCTEQEGGFYLTSRFIVSKLDSLYIINKNPIWRKPVFVFVPDAPRCKQRNSCQGNQKHDLKKRFLLVVVMFVQQLGSLILVTKLLINLVSADQLFSIDILSDASSIPPADISNSISRFTNLELSQRRQSRLIFSHG